MLKKPKDVIRDYRIEAKKTCAEMAALLGVAESTLRSYENGTRAITPARAKEFEVATGNGLSRRALCPDIWGESEDVAA